MDVYLQAEVRGHRITLVSNSNIQNYNHRSLKMHEKI